MVFCSSSKSARWYWPADKITHSRLSASGALDPSLDLIVVLEFHESPMHGRLHHNAFHHHHAPPTRSRLASLFGLLLLSRVVPSILFLLGLTLRTLLLPDRHLRLVVRELSLELQGIKEFEGLHVVLDRILLGLFPFLLQPLDL